MDERTATEQIDDIIKNATDWQGDLLADLRSVILAANPEITEEVKWKKPSKPEGVAVWVHDGNICMADILKNAVRLTFPKGAGLSDPDKLFNTRLDGKTVRAIDFTKGITINKKALTALIIEATV
jgi:hypothetical protein